MTESIYRRPSWTRRRIVDPLLRTMVLRAGIGRRDGQNLMRVLRVRGRLTGLDRDVPMRVAVWEGRRYVVSLLGEAQWVRNLRAAGTAELVLGRRAEPVHASEVEGDEKTGFLRWYCGQPAHRLSVRAGLRVDPANLTPADVDRLVREHPIFRLDPVTPVDRR